MNSNYYSNNLPGYFSMESPTNDEFKLRKFLRTHFGDNDIHEPFDQRRWITYDMSRYIFFRDERDALLFTLKWKQ